MTCQEEKRSVSRDKNLLSIIHSLASGLQFIDDFFFFDSPVLEPNSDLPLWQVGGGWYPAPFVLSDEFICRIFPF